MLPFSWIYSLIMRLRRWFYEKGFLTSYKASIPIISIGNLSTGGTGKTPFAEYLLEYLSQQGLKPAYLSRGYGRSSKGCLKLDANTPDPAKFGDEATQVSLKFPELSVWVSEKRETGIKQIIAEGDSELVVLDDAFQHLKVQRDLNILMIDAQRMPGQDFVLPAGNLRERRSTLRKADFLIINKIKKVEQVEYLRRKLGRYGVETACCRPVFQHPMPFKMAGRTPRDWQKLPVILFSGIGNHAFFQQMVAELGADIIFEKEFADHHAYNPHQLTSLEASRIDHEKRLGQKVWVVTTEKDRMRLLKKDLNFGERWIYFPIKLEWLAGKEAFLKKINQTLAPKSS